jgi:hypothetical protein
LVPSLKFGELLTEPVIDPSRFWVHPLITGILSFGAALAAGFLPPNIDKVGRGAAAGAAAGFGDPKIDKVGRAAVFFGAGVDTDFRAGFGEKMDRVGRAAAFFGAGFGDEKMDRVGRTAAFLGAGVGAALGAGAVLGAPKNEKG